MVQKATGVEKTSMGAKQTQEGREKELYEWKRQPSWLKARFIRQRPRVERALSSKRAAAYTGEQNGRRKNLRTGSIKPAKSYGRVERANPGRKKKTERGGEKKPPKVEKKQGALHIYNTYIYIYKL